MSAKIVSSLLFFWLTAPAIAQETTATLNGIATDEKGMAIAGATIALKHIPTGLQTLTQTNNRGIYVIPNLKPGGPYTITISFVGYQSQTLNNVMLSLGSNPDQNFLLRSTESTLTEVIVTGTKKLPAGVTIGRQQLASLPTLGRSLQDFTRLTPQSNNNAFAGTNFRYNNITLDGAVNNDAISFSNSFGGISGGGQAGTAGSGTRTNPYSLDVIQEVQVRLTPYDVKLGNFTGGSVNAVTKSGTNQIHGSVYGYGRNQALVGKSIDGSKTKIGSDFYDYQTGAMISGPIVQNKLFYIFNAEFTRRQEPTFYNAGEQGAAVTQAEAESIIDFLKTKYNYDPGSYGRTTISTNSDKYFGRIDWNLSNKSTLMLRAIYTHGYGQNLERSSTNFQFSNFDFTQHSKNLNMVAELKTRLSNTLNNQLLISYINVHDYRNFPGQLAPMIDIDNGRIWAGTWREASVYNMRQKTLELTDNVTLNKGIHKFTLGTHNELYAITYGFLNSWNGRWEYANGINSFLASLPSRIRGVFPFDAGKNNYLELSNNLPGSEYTAILLSGYAQDEVSFSKKLKLTAGLRFDYPFLTKKFGIDPELNTTKDYASANPTFTHTPFSELNNDYLRSVTVSPRIGFTYDINGDQVVVLRGGSGIFVGRMPFAWLGYASTLTGNYYGGIDYKPGGATIGLAMDPANLKDTVGKYGGAAASATREVDVVNDHFKLPTIWRSNIAVDFKFGNGYKFTVDAMYTKTIHDVKFQQINVKDSVQYFTAGPAQTPVYVGGKLNTSYSNVYLLTNTSEGYRYNFTAQLSSLRSNIAAGGSKSFRYNWSLAYTYGMSKDISNGIRNSWSSNYEVNPAIIPSSPALGYSNFDLRHRIVAVVSTGLRWNNANTTSLAFFYAGQSGSPYSLIYTSAPFNNASNAPLPYIPKDQNDIRLADYTVNGQAYTAAQQWDDLNSFIEKDAYLKTRR